MALAAPHDDDLEMDEPTAQDRPQLCVELPYQKHDTTTWV